jgi:hypothetical protein
LNKIHQAWKVRMLVIEIIVLNIIVIMVLIPLFLFRRLIPRDILS